MTPAHNHNKHDAHDHNADPKKTFAPLRHRVKKTRIPQQEDTPL